MTSLPDKEHPYNDNLHFERVTPVDDIPEEYRMVANLPLGAKQIIDSRLAYCFNRTLGQMVECGSKAVDARENP